jgi:hypothetical protein
MADEENPEVRDQNERDLLRTRLRRWKDTLQSKFFYPAPDGSPRQPDDFTSRVFLGLPYPMPVVDVLDSDQIDREYLISMRLIFQVFVVQVRSVGLYLTGSIAAPFIELIFSITGLRLPLPPLSGFFIEQKSWVCNLFLI